MDINAAAGHLRKLAKSNRHRSKTGQLRELYEEIELARQAGVTTERIVDALNENGLDISLGTFVTLLHRIRKKNPSISPKHRTEPNKAPIVVNSGVDGEAELKIAPPVRPDGITDGEWHTMQMKHKSEQRLKARQSNN